MPQERSPRGAGHAHVYPGSEGVRRAGVRAVYRMIGDVFTSLGASGLLQREIGKREMKWRGA